MGLVLEIKGCFFDLGGVVVLMNREEDLDEF